MVAASPARVITASGVMVRASMLARNDRRYSRRARIATAIQSPVMARLAQLSWRQSSPRPQG